MNNVAQTRNREARLEAVLSESYVLPATLALNTEALLALDGIPQWVKTAAALFLAF